MASSSQIPPADAACSELAPLGKTCEAQGWLCYAVALKTPHWTAAPAIRKRVMRKGHHSAGRSKCGSQMTFSENKRGMDVGGLWQASCSHLSSQPSKAFEMATAKSSRLARGSLVAPLQKPPILFPQSPLALHLLWGKLGPLARRSCLSSCQMLEDTGSAAAARCLQLATAGEGRQAACEVAWQGLRKDRALAANIRESESTSCVRLELLLAP